jgi:hypothetical protein
MPMTHVLNYDVFLKKEINEQALVDYAKHSMRAYKDTMKQDQERYVRVCAMIREIHVRVERFLLVTQSND